MIKAIKIIFLPTFSVRLEKNAGKGNKFSKVKFGSSRLKFISKIGKSKKAINNELINPTLIIPPKLITGSIPEKTKDEKPAIVVNAVKRQGLIIM